MDRIKYINGVVKNITDNAKVALEGARCTYSCILGDKGVPEQFKLKQ